MIDYQAIMAQRRLNNAADSIKLPEAFAAKFPDLKPAKADKLFRRYLDTVVAALIGKLPFLRDGETYISTHGLLNGAGDFKYKNQRFWVWNEFRDIYPLLIVLEVGSNVKAANNPFEKNTKVKIVNERFLNMLLEEKSPADVFNHFYSDEDMAHPDLSEVAIDMENLRRYIGCTEYELETATHQNHRAKLQGNLWQAKLIYKIGQHTENELGTALLPLIPAPSAFGRTYYRGMNIQNVSKQVRSAIIGHHYQYDMNAAVFAIKLYLYGSIMGGDNAFVGTMLGSYTRQYLNEKNIIRKRLARHCFSGVNVSDEAAVKAIKNALTAIGFGAKTSGKTWMTDGERQGTALTEILMSNEVRTTFLADPWVKAFLAEQLVIEDAILKNAEESEDHEAMCQAIRDNNGANGRATKHGKLAYMYQHWETHVMDLAVDVLRHYGIEVVARIHDAFIVRDKLPTRVLDDIQAQWGLRDYLSLDCDEVREWVEADYKRGRVRADEEEAEHLKRMESAEQIARIYQIKKKGLVA